MTLFVLSVIALALAGLYAALSAVNLAVLRPPPMPPEGTRLPAVSVLVPARDEAENIGPALEAILASAGARFEVVVLDDGSTDATPTIVRDLAARDPRLRLIEGAPLPRGWNGKQHACWQLAQAARNPVLLFVDADVRLAPDALRRIAGYMTRHDLDLASGFPRQITGSLAERLAIPQILVLLLGYLPLPMARRLRGVGFAAGCGQLMAVRAEAYRRADGHRAIAASMHDGLTLPRAVRRAGGRTDLFDATPLATCRMYRGWRQVWDGFSKNAVEGMATPVALPIWTLLLGGGHVLPILAAIAAALAGERTPLALSLLALALMLGARLATALRARQGLLAVLLHPAGIVLTLAIQWSALVNARRGRPARWRGRVYGAG